MKTVKTAKKAPSASKAKSAPAAETKRKCVLAIAAHPDDIEFTMAGTLLALQERGWEVHYFNVANGCGGSMVMNAKETARARLGEAKAACKLAGFTHYPPITDDLAIAHTIDQIARTLAVIRMAQPSIILTQSPQDYMEDHQNATRLAVTAAFAKGIQNAPCKPAKPAYFHDAIVYHGMAHGLRDMLGKRLHSGMWVNVAKHIEMKKRMLACHASQKDWLDASQGMDSYITTMVELTASMGKMSGKFNLAEGWRRHNPLGYAADTSYDPLREALGKEVIIDKKYAKWLEE